MFALDSNTLIYFFKGAGRVAEHMLAVAPSDTAIPAVVVYEIEAGISQSRHPSRRRAQLDSLLSIVPVLPLDANSAKQAARVGGLLHKAGTPIGPLDALIAGIALAHGATLVTHNVKEFRRVRDLSVVDWF